MWKLFRALIDPREHEADFFRRERFDAGLVFQRRHPAVRIFGLMSDSFYQQAVRTVAGRENLAVLAALERAFEGVQLEPGFRLVAAVAFHAGRVEKRLDFGGVSHAGLGRGGWQLGVLGGSSHGKTEGRRQRGERKFGRIHYHFNQWNWFDLVTVAK